MRDAAKKIMGDVQIAYIEGIGGVRVAEMDIVEVGKNDVSDYIPSSVVCRGPKANNYDPRYYHLRLERLNCIIKTCRGFRGKRGHGSSKKNNDKIIESGIQE